MEIMRIASAAAAAAESAEAKNHESADNVSSSPPLPNSPALQNTTAAVGSLLAQLCPTPKSILCKMQAGNDCQTKIDCARYDAQRYRIFANIFLSQIHKFYTPFIFGFA